MALADITQSSSILRSKLNPNPYLQLAVLVLLVGSVVLNVALAQRLKGANSRLLAMKMETNVSVGDFLPDIEAKNLDGTHASFSYSDDQRPTVLYIFSPSCKWCEKNLENIKNLSEQKRSEYRFVGLSISGKDLSEYVAKQNWKFPVLMDPSPETVLTYKLGGTPQTVLISHDGEVMKNWSGAYMKNLKTEVESYFQVNLPGIRE